MEVAPDGRSGSEEEESNASPVEPQKKVIAQRANLRKPSITDGTRFKRYSLTEPFLMGRCCKFFGNYLYMDLPGKIVEQTLNRRIDDSDLPFICGYLRAHRDVVYLNLSYNSITGIGFTFLAHFLAAHKRIKSLNLVHNEITTINEEVVRKTATFWRLRCLILTGNKFGRQGGVQIARILRLNTSITHLDIGETDQTIQSLPYVVESLLDHLNGNTTLQKVDLTRVIPSSYGQRLDSAHLCRLMEELLLHNSTLVEIHITKNEICDSDLELLSDGLKKNKALELLNLTANRLSSYGMEILADILPRTNITALLVSSNRIGDDGAIALGRVFSQTKLRYLDISYNRIRNIGFMNLLWGMKAQVPPVHTFFFYGNPLDHESPQILHVQLFLNHIAPYAIDVQFIWKENELFMVEDRTVNRYTNIRYFVHDMSHNGQPVCQHCCYYVNERYHTMVDDNESSSTLSQLPHTENEDRHSKSK